jgi:hypothetical protein
VVRIVAEEEEACFRFVLLGCCYPIVPPFPNHR